MCRQTGLVGMLHGRGTATGDIPGQGPSTCRRSAVQWTGVSCFPWVEVESIAADTHFIDKQIVSDHASWLFMAFRMNI